MAFWHEIEFCLVDLNLKCCKSELLCTPHTMSREKLQIVWLSIQITFCGSEGRNWYFLANFTIFNLQLQTVWLTFFNMTSINKKSIKISPLHSVKVNYTLQLKNVILLLCSYCSSLCITRLHYSSISYYFVFYMQKVLSLFFQI